MEAGGKQSQKPAESADGDAKPVNGGTAPDGAHKEETAAAQPGGVYHLWRSRDNRKGRHAVIVPPSSGAGASDKHGDGGVSHPGASDSLKEVMRGVWKMAVRYPVWDVSYDVAVLFTLGESSL